MLNIKTGPKFNIHLLLGPLLFILYISEIFDLVENRLFAYADDSTLLAVIRRPSDRPTVAASVKGDLA